MVKVFFSYPRSDVNIRNQLDESFAVLKNNKVIETWHDLKMRAGIEYDPVILRNLQESDIVLLLLSIDFFKSKYCPKEMAIALDMHDKGKAKVIPILVNHCQWKDTELEKFNILPTGEKPIKTFRNKAEAYKEISDEIKIIAENIDENKKEKERKQREEFRRKKQKEAHRRRKRREAYREKAKVLSRKVLSYRRLIYDFLISN